MNKFLMLLLVVTATQAAAEEPSIATLTVADFQKKYESESDDQNREFQNAAQAYFNGYEIGFYDGTMAALAAAVSNSEKPLSSATPGGLRPTVLGSVASALLRLKGSSAHCAAVYAVPLAPSEFSLLLAMEER